MPITSIPYQPATSQLLAAYRPVVFQVQATRTDGAAQPPYVSCDIYIADLYYKSVIRTAPETITSEYTIFQFDISDALQEYLQPDLATLNNNNVLQAPHMSGKVFCRFRSSGLDVDGFTVEEGTKPVQGTKFTAPIPGSGTQSNTFFAINSSLQHEDNQNLAVHLNAYKTGAWANNAFPLTHRNRYFFCNNDSDHFPFIYSGDCLATDIILSYRLRGQTSFQEATAQDLNVCEGIEFITQVTGNRVDVSLDDPIPDGQSVLVQYKRQSDSVWIDVGTFTTQDFGFNVNGDDIAGDYDIRVIHFCTPCLSAEPETGTFTLDGEEINLAWRGINPFCVQQTLDQPVYIKLELRNPTEDQVYFPNSDDPATLTMIFKSDLFCLFFSDANLLNPLFVNQNDLSVYVKQRSEIGATNTFGDSYREVETLLHYTVDANGTEVYLGNVITDQQFQSFPPLSPATSDTDNFYTPYPTPALSGGNTGQKGFTTLQEYNTDTNLPTGNTKPNNTGDPDYAPPVNDSTTCPGGPDATTLSYTESLNISKVQLNYNGTTNIYGETEADTNAGGYTYVLPLPRNTPVTISIKAKTLDMGNISGYVKCKITYYDSGGNLQSFEANIPNDIETTLPASFSNISNITISNY